MKKNFLFGLIFLAVTLSITAQEKILTESEFNEVLAKTEQNLKNINYRLTKTEELFLKAGEKPEKTRIEINEYLLPDKWREVVEIKSKDENSIEERIWDGKKLFERTNNGEWKKYDGGNIVSYSIKSGRVTKTFKFIETIQLDGNTVNIYEAEIRRVANKATQTSIYQVEYLHKVKYWISADNYLLKKLTEYTIVGSESVGIEVWKYEYNPKDLKIEAPIK